MQLHWSGYNSLRDLQLALYQYAHNILMFLTVKGVYLMNETLQGPALITGLSNIIWIPKALFILVHVINNNI